MLEFKNLEEQYIEAASRLAMVEYRDEKNDQLIPYDFTQELKSMISKLFKNGKGKVAIERGKLVGYIAFWGPWDGFFGKVKDKDKVVAYMEIDDTAENFITMNLCLEPMIKTLEPIMQQTAKR